MEHISEIISDHCKLAEEVKNSASNLSVLADKVIEQISYFKIESTGSSRSEKSNAGTPGRETIFHMTANKFREMFSMN